MGFIRGLLRWIGGIFLGRTSRARRARLARRRRREDIYYLGRDVSGRLGVRKSRAAVLTGRGLPVLNTPAGLARTLGLTVKRLRWLAYHNEAADCVHYIQREVPKRNGGVRTLQVPHRTLAAAQRWIHAEILSKLEVDPAAHGFVAGRSIATNAGAHAGRAVVVGMDLEAFFPSIGFFRVRAVFERIGYSPALATVFALLCTECPRRQEVRGKTTYHVATGPRGLPQGACTSPALSNQVAWRLDRRLGGLAAKLGLVYTRYADDLTFSDGEDADAKVGYLIARVRHIAADEGFAVNESKTRVLRRNAAQVVTGLVVNDRPGVRREEVRRLRAILHRAKVDGWHAVEREGHSPVRAWLLGKIAFVAMARPDVGAKLRAEFDTIVAAEPR